MPGKLNDRYLYAPANAKVLEAAYSDVWETLKEPVETLEELTGFRGFLMKWFGVLLTYTKARSGPTKKGQARLLKIASLKEAAQGLVYPSRLFSYG